MDTGIQRHTADAGGALNLYPSFSLLDTQDRVRFEHLTAEYEPFSEFTFVNAFCWSSRETIRASELHGNLVLEYRDFETGAPVLSVLGCREIDMTLERLLEDVGHLRFVPEVVVSRIEQRAAFRITEDPANADYVFEVAAYLRDGPSRRRSQHIRQFKSRYPKSVVTVTPLADPEGADRILAIFDAWAAPRSDKADTALERTALAKLLTVADELGVEAAVLQVDNRDVAFSIFDLERGRFAMVRFHKAIAEVRHADAWLSDWTFRLFATYGCEWVSWEQDLGIPGLQTFKQSFRPARFLQKYIVRRR